MSDRLEVAAQLAAYAHENYSTELFTLAGEVALGMHAEPAAALDEAHQLSQNRRTTFDAWQARPDVPSIIETRVVLQENYERYAGRIRPLEWKAAQAAGMLSLGPFRRGSQAAAMRLKEKDGSLVIAKVPLGETEDGFRRAPVTLADRASFAERRVRMLPSVPAEVNFEQVRAIHYGGRVVSTGIPGRQLYKLTEKELGAVTDGDLEKAISDLIALAGAGVRQDGNGANTHFGFGTGFGFFDPLEANANYKWALWSNLTDMAKGLKDAEESPRRARTPACVALRQDLFHRFNELVPIVSPGAQAVLDELNRK